MPCSNRLSYFTTKEREFLGSKALLSTKAQESNKSMTYTQSRGEAAVNGAGEREPQRVDRSREA
jgi:hypothetical protein